VIDRSPTGLELGVVLLVLLTLLRFAEWVVVFSPEGRLCSIEHQALDAIRMRDGEQDCERPTLAPAQHMGGG
jgi:hypothetical protein